MKCIIIDDEPLAIEIIENYITQVGGMEIIAKCTNPIEAVSILKKSKVDLVFLDIEMPNLTGIDLVKIIDNMPQFIFTTAYPNYALEGFDLNATDYLVKPIPFHRFVKAVSKAKDKFESKNKDTEDSITRQSQNIQDHSNFIFVKSEYENIKINIDSIKYIQGLKDYIKIYTTQTTKAILTLSNFKDILEKLPPKTFIRVHRSYIVNISKIETHQKTKLLIDGNYIPIGESYKNEVLKQLGI